jgi:hypothetical protein
MEGTSSEDFFKTHARRIDHGSRQRAFWNMKLSIEAKVAAAVAVAFAALSLGAIAQEGSEHGPVGPSQESETSLADQSLTGESQLLAQY